MVLGSVIEHNRYLVGVNLNDLSEFFCLIATRFFLAKAQGCGSETGYVG